MMNLARNEFPRAVGHLVAAHAARHAGTMIAVVACSISFGLVWVALQTQPEGGPPGRAIPTKLPDEANRVHFASGVSIVLPPNWVHRDYDLLFIAARSQGRFPGLIRMGSIGGDPPADLVGFKPTRFHGQSAHERMVVERRWALDDPALSVYTLYFVRDGTWYQLDYVVARECEELPPIIRRYIETLRWDDEAP